MIKIFSYDGPLMRLLEKAFDLMLLHILFVICSIPIITIGASTTALISVSMKSIRGEEGYIFRTFFKEFKNNFKQSSCIWFIFVLIISWCLAFIIFSFNVGSESAKILELIEAAVLFIIIGAFKYVFAVQARFENDLFSTIKNSFFLSLRHFPTTFILIAMTVMPPVFTVYLTGISTVSACLIFIWLFFGTSLIAHADAYFLVKVFSIYEQEV